MQRLLQLECHPCCPLYRPVNENPCARSGNRWRRMKNRPCRTRHGPVMSKSKDEAATNRFLGGFVFFDPANRLPRLTSLTLRGLLVVAVTLHVAGEPFALAKALEPLQHLLDRLVASWPDLDQNALLKPTHCPPRPPGSHSIGRLCTVTIRATSEKSSYLRPSGRAWLVPRHSRFYGSGVGGMGKLVCPWSLAKHGLRRAGARSSLRFSMAPAISSASAHLVATRTSLARIARERGN